MKLTNEHKTQILEAMKSSRENYASDSKHATALGITASVYNALKQGKTDKQLSEGGWISLARRLGVTLGSSKPWKIAPTPTFVYISEQLRLCQEGHLSKILCDMPNIGKTVAAEEYARTHKHTVYVDCSQCKTKTRLIESIARGFGLSTNGRYHDVYDDLAHYLRHIDTPLVILDEAGDLEYKAFLELKGLWNATKGMCGWYMMGADGLAAKMSRSIKSKKVGYAEMFSRYNDEFDKVSPLDGDHLQPFLRAQTEIVARANAPEGADIKALIVRAGGSLRRLRHELEKDHQLTIA